MFFFFSKLLFFLTQPINWIIAILLAALFFKNPHRKRRLLQTGFFLLVLFTNHSIFNSIIHWWEPETLTADQIIEPYDVAILLGGFSNFSITPDHDRYNLSERGNRLTQTLELYFAGKVKKILITGGTGAPLNEHPPEATAIRPLLIEFGIAENDIIIENQSQNTYENALFTKAILAKDYPNASCLLITSAFHIPRASACFKQQNIDFTPYAVDYMQEKLEWTPEFLIIPNSWTLMRWGILIKEWIGYGAYWTKGYL